MVRQRFTSKTLALNALARARTQALDGLGITPAESKTTLADYAPRWLAAQQCRPSTLVMYEPTSVTTSCPFSAASRWVRRAAVTSARSWWC